MALHLKGQGQPLVTLTGMVDWELSGALNGELELAQYVPGLAPGTHSSPSCFIAASGAKVLLPGRAHTLREWSHLGPDPQGFCSSNLGPAPIPDR